jgi:cyclomaltodextrin glucanotransferase
MKIMMLSGALLACCASSVHADWYLRGTHNAWVAQQMLAVTSNTYELPNVLFSSAGVVKFDRFGDWTENYGVGGRNGSNIAVAAGTHTIRFFTDTKNWVIAPETRYHLRGTFNAWAEGNFLTRVGSSDVYEACRQFAAGDAGGAPRFKIDPNGGWGDAVPATDVLVNPGWVKISFNQATRAVSLAQNLSANCGSEPPTTQFFLRGTQNAWAATDAFTPVPASAELEICRQFTTGDANGGPRFKVDPNGGWGADAFPAVDVPAAGWTKIVINGATSSIVSTTTNMGANCTAAPLADDFRARTMYFLFVDRFANGNTLNDKGTNPVGTSTVKANGAMSEWKKYWGGDIQGLIDKLDYLKALGVGAIWVTPLMDNVDAGTEGAYHGYWAHDFYEVDEHLGDWALIDELKRQAQDRDIKLVLDIALNHSNQSDEVEFGRLLKEGGFVTDFASGRGTWYHNFGSIADCGDANPATVCDGRNGTANEWNDPWSFRNKQLFNLSDFNHGVSSNSVADEYLINAALKWMDHGIDAFRIDAIKHIEPSFINRFSAAVRAKNPNTYIFGEWYGAGASDPGSMAFLNERRGSELLDFNLRDNIEKAIANEQGMQALSAHILARPSAMTNQDSYQPIFLDNHDATRTSVYLQTNGKTNRGFGKGYAKSFADARQNLGMALVMTLPGIPTVYYGTEQNVTWFSANADGMVGQDPYNREMMPGFDQTTTAFSMISKLANLRKNSPAIQRGTYAERWANADVLVYQRQSGADCAVIAVNRGPQTSVTVPNLCLANGIYSNIVGGDAVNLSGGTATLDLSQNEVIVLR